MDLEKTLAPALSVLCQAYLLTFSANDGSPAIDKSDRMYDIVASALNVMELREFSRFGEGAFLSRTAYLQKRSMVTRLSWWANILEGADSPDQEAIKFIGPYTGLLVQRIFSGVSSEALSADPEITLDIVAPAYLELHEFLSGSEKREILLLQKPSLSIVSNWREVISDIAQNSTVLYQLDWKQFENLMAYLLEKFGWSVEPMGYTKDGGIDIIAVRKVDPDIDFRMMVQCKRFSGNHKVGIEIVREIFSVKWEHGFNQAMIATTSSFTKGALEKAEFWNLELKDHTAIADWCKKYSQVIGPKNV
jgi:hypothetical protein